VKNSRWLDGVIHVLLVLAILVDGGMYFYVKHHSTEDPQTIYRFAAEKDLIAAPGGFTSSGAKVQRDGPAKSRWVVRYTSRACHYCRADEALWNPLLKKLRSAGYDVYVVLPNSKVEFSAGDEAIAGANQVAFVDAGWVRRLRLSKTPTLMVFDAERGLIWMHEGTLGQNDPSAVWKAVRSTGSF
jgi:hypothetical protein